jgi:hypothetical protein
LQIGAAIPAQVARRMAAAARLRYGRRRSDREDRMQRYEYRVVPAPARAEKLRGVRSTEDRFAQTLAALINAQARDGWEFQRAETLPSEEKVGFTKRRTVYLNLLVFRRPLTGAEPEKAAERPLLLAEPPAGAAPRLQPLGEGLAPKLGPAG